MNYIFIEIKEQRHAKKQNGKFDTENNIFMISFQSIFKNQNWFVLFLTFIFIINEDQIWAKLLKIM